MSAVAANAWRERAALSVEEAAKVLGVSRGSAYAAVKQGELPAKRVGRRWLVPVGELLAFLGESR